MSGDMRRLTTLTASCLLLGFSVGYGVWQLAPIAGAVVACHLVPPVVQRLRRARTTVDELADPDVRIDPVTGMPCACLECEPIDDGCGCAEPCSMGPSCPGWMLQTDPPPVDELHPRRQARTRRDVRHG